MASYQALLTRRVPLDARTSGACVGSSSALHSGAARAGREVNVQVGSVAWTSDRPVSGRSSGLGRARKYTPENFCLILRFEAIERGRLTISRSSAHCRTGVSPLSDPVTPKEKRKGPFFAGAETAFSVLLQCLPSHQSEIECPPPVAGGSSVTVMTRPSFRKTRYEQSFLWGCPARLIVAQFMS